MKDGGRYTKTLIEIQFKAPHTENQLDSLNEKERNFELLQT